MYVDKFKALIANICVVNKQTNKGTECFGECLTAEAGLNISARFHA
jgi:hypothetical protein